MSGMLAFDYGKIRIRIVPVKRNDYHNTFYFNNITQYKRDIRIEYATDLNGPHTHRYR